MDRVSAQGAEITRGLVQAGAEMPLPDPVHCHSSEQWILRRGQPVHECLPTPVTELGFGLRERESRLHWLAQAGAGWITGRQHVVRFRRTLGIIFHGPEYRQRLGRL